MVKFTAKTTVQLEGFKRYLSISCCEASSTARRTITSVTFASLYAQVNYRVATDPGKV